MTASDGTAGDLISRSPLEGREHSGAEGTPARVRRPLTLPVLRPPGAVPELAFLAGCTKCDACATACPYDAIVPAPARFKAAAGTPMIDPANAACHMCPDTPCIAACEPRVLRADRPLKMGTAVIQTWNCLAHQRSFCTTCAERCPVPGALTIVAGKPQVNEAACTGCGLCQWACPAPTNAVMILSRPDRPPTREVVAT